jgi:predicted transcriptional regulator YheO
MLKALAVPLAQALGAGNEVVVHDLSRVPNSIVAIGGELTGRRVGGPMTDLLLRHLRQDHTDNLLRYRTKTPSGQPLLSSTIFVKDGEGRPIACLCVNTDLARWSQAQAMLTQFMAELGPESGQPARLSESSKGLSETFPITVENLTVASVERVISEIGVPIHLMQKQHKLEVVRRLEALGLFLIRDAVDYVARALEVTRYTIYNYLSDLRSEPTASSWPTRRATMKRLPLESTDYSSRESVAVDNSSPVTSKKPHAL